MDRTRASDTEREWVVGLLRDAVAHGRITVDELDERSEAAYAARTRGELAALIDDLPQPPPRPAPPPPPPPPPPPATARVVPRPREYAPVSPPWERPWPGLRTWMPGMQLFADQWAGPPDPRRAGRFVLERVVPLFTVVNYTIIHRTGDQLVLRNALHAIVRIDMAVADDHTRTYVWGAAPLSARQALERLPR